MFNPVNDEYLLLFSVCEIKLRFSVQLSRQYNVPMVSFRYIVAALRSVIDHPF